MSKIGKLGWRPDVPDHNDLLYAAPMFKGPLPRSVSLSGSRFNPPIWDQDDLGSCTAHGVGRCFQFALQRIGLRENFMPSRLFIYYQERVMENSVESDAGAEIRDGMKVVHKFGVPHENLWGYDINKFAIKPPQQAYDDALKHQTIIYRRIVRSLAQMKGCLAQGYPFTFGFTVYESFQNIGSDGIGTLPESNDGILGGHCVACTGYDDDTHRFECANSWGTRWGEKGYFYLPYSYLLDEGLSDDFWQIQTVET